MKNLKNASREEANAVARLELEKAGILCIESELGSVVGATVFGVIQFKHMKKILTFQRCNDCWMLRMNAVLSPSEREYLDKYVVFSRLMKTFRRKSGDTIMIQHWLVANQKKLRLLINALTRYWGRRSKVKVATEELYDQRLLSNYSDPSPQ